MREFEHWQKHRVAKTLGFITSVGYYEFGEKEGWNAALLRVLKMINKGRVISLDHLKMALEEELKDQIISLEL